MNKLGAARDEQGVVLYVLRVCGLGMHLLHVRSPAVDGQLFVDSP